MGADLQVMHSNRAPHRFDRGTHLAVVLRGFLVEVEHGQQLAKRGEARFVFLSPDGFLHAEPQFACRDGRYAEPVPEPVEALARWKELHP